MIDVSTPGADKVYFVGTGGGTVLPVSQGDWAILGADESTWSLSADGFMTEYASIDPLGAQGAHWVTAPGLAVDLPGPGGQQWLLRHHFTLPAGVVTAASLSIAPDDYCFGAFINGIGIAGGTGIGFGQVFTATMDGSIFREGDNLLALMMLNGATSAPGPTRLQFVLRVTVSSSGTLATGSGWQPGTTGAVDDAGTSWLQLVHKSGHVALSSDGTTVLLKSQDRTMLQTPFPTLTTPPAAILGKDPASGLPMWSSANYATIPDVPATTGPVPLPPDPPPPVTDVPSPKAVLHVVPKRKPVPIADPVVDYCPIARCGAAYYLSQKLAEQYELVRSFLLAMLATPAIFGILPDALLLTALDILIDWLAARVAIDAFVVHVVQQLAELVLKGARFVNTDFEALGVGGATTLQRLAYASLSCSGNEFVLTPDMLVAWELAINSDTIDFSEWQRHTLVYCVQFTPFSTYHQLAQHGAMIGSSDCEGW